jgi:hypothetical protein
MDRRTLIVSGLVTVAAGAAHGQQPAPSSDVQSAPLPPAQGGPPSGGHAASGVPESKTYSQDEIVGGVSDFLGVTAESAGAVVEKLFSKNGRPTGYIAGEEGSGAFVVGARYGRGLLYMKDKPPLEVFWQGPTAGWDFGGNASRVFTLCYNLQVPEVIFQRFPGVEGSAYLVGGLGVNYQKADSVTLAPIRAGVGLRLGASVGYLSYTRKRNKWPF